MEPAKQFDLSVLYVEDDDLTRKEVRELLQERFREVFAARNGAEGLELFRKKTPDLVVTDILMPVMDGLQMAKHIRAANSDVPVIVTTAHDETSYMIEAIDASVDQFVIKPIVLKKFFAALQRCAEVVGARRAAKQHEDEREKLIAELQEALSKVKQLSGLLPICASCKKIRDDRGYWSQIEDYIRGHSEAEFSHGLCPECTQKLYPRLGKDKK